MARSKRLPKQIQAFVEQQHTVPVAKLFQNDLAESPSPYGSYWYRAVACMLLSGRVQPKQDGYPNRTELNRLCKEANFNQYLFERIARFLAAMDVIT